jgi:aspartate carbamoyltransferase catalytic subunit
MDTILSVDDLSDDDLKRLMDKYHEKQTRYDLKMNEATERNKKIINMIYLEQATRLINKNVQMFRESRMDLSKD